MTITAGLGGASRHGCVALADGDRLIGVCGQERVTRVRGAGFNGTGLPDEALDLLLSRSGRMRAEVTRYVAAEATVARHDAIVRIDHALAHACTAFLTSPFEAAAVVVCDEDAPFVSVWDARGNGLTRVEWDWDGPGFAEVYTRIGAAFGFSPARRDHRIEALTRLHPDARDVRVPPLVTYRERALHVDERLEREVERLIAGEGDNLSRAPVAATLQAQLGDALSGFLADVRRLTGNHHLCVGGSFFYYSWANTAARRAGHFDAVFVPVDPGNPGLAVGAALHAGGGPPRPVSPFLGPSYSGQEIKETLDNCKLHYGWESEDGVIATVVKALQQGTLVGWFDGGMEWGPRALGARCILANPFAPYVLENLNRFLKHREPWRGFALSGLERAVAEQFDGPGEAPFMEGDYRPRDARRFANVLPAPAAAIRVQTVGAGALPRFARLLAAFGAASGQPFLVNTSFNGFHEPIVCSPRDAVRVFYGSGLDLLVLDGFVLRK